MRLVGLRHTRLVRKPPRPTSRELVEQSLARIAEVDPLVSAVCTLDPTARAQADERDAESAGGTDRGPLHGVPLLIKDNVDTAGLSTTAGSLALAGAEPPAADAELVRRARAAGMVVVGKANLSEWANFRDGESTSGWSAYGGLTLNPYALNRSAGGSSSGSGAAVAAGMVALAVGTETDGSITSPAAYNGCVGLKPTVGLVPTSGVVPISASQDAPGALAGSVAGAAALLAVLADLPDLGAAAGPDGLVGKRLGVPRAPWWGYSRHADAAGEAALRLLSDAGAVIVDDVDLGELTTYGSDDEVAVLLAEFRSGLDDYLATRQGDGVPRTLADLLAFNRAHAEVELACFGQSILRGSTRGRRRRDGRLRRRPCPLRRGLARRDRPSAGRARPRRARDAVLPPGPPDRPGQRRARGRVVHQPDRDGRLPAADRARAPGRRAPGRGVVLGHGPQRGRPHRCRRRLRGRT